MRHSSVQLDGRSVHLFRLGARFKRKTALKAATAIMRVLVKWQYYDETGIYNSLRETSMRLTKVDKVYRNPIVTSWELGIGNAIVFGLLLYVLVVMWLKKKMMTMFHFLIGFFFCTDYENDFKVVCITFCKLYPSFREPTEFLLVCHLYIWDL
jgi:hypothetical protein